MEDRFQIDRFAVKNFRSIQECDVELAPLTFFIGPNASGKTSFVDAMLFVGSALRSSLGKAIADRGGIHSILHNPIKLPTGAQFDFYLSSPLDFTCEFHLELRIVEGWSVSVAREECLIRESGAQHHYLVEDGSVKGTATVFPAVSADRIFLSNASGLPEFRLLFDFLAGLEWTEPMPPAIYQIAQGFARAARIHHPVSEYTRLAPPLPTLTRNQPTPLDTL